jgi:hypothetical protein
MRHPGLALTVAVLAALALAERAPELLRLPLPTPPAGTSSIAFLPGAAGMIVAIDPVTGELGMPTPEQWAELFAAQPSPEVLEGLNHSSDGLRQVQHADGHVSLELAGRFMEFAIARMGKDGKLTFGCVNDPKGLERGSQALAPASAPATPEER